jgi:hypothetical protein
LVTSSYAAVKPAGPAPIIIAHLFIIKAVSIKKFCAKRIKNKPLFLITAFTNLKKHRISLSCLSMES